MAEKPTVFIASSKEAHPVALGVLQNLTADAKPKAWDSAFEIGKTTIDELLRNFAQSKFGVFVFAPDDLTTIRGATVASVRDNVILELGMLLGLRGPARSFIIRPDDPKILLPTDLLGIVTEEYQASEVEDNAKAATQGACAAIVQAMRKRLAEDQQQSAGKNEIYARALDAKVNQVLEAVCRAMSVKWHWFETSVRVFVFRHEGDFLVCRYFWPPDNAVEEIGITRFKIDDKEKDKIVVLRCFIDDRVRTGEASDTEAGDVSPLPAGEFPVVKEALSHVLAAPIRREDKTVWGVVDFDASNKEGMELLASKHSKDVIKKLAEHLATVLCNEPRFD